MNKDFFLKQFNRLIKNRWWIMASIVILVLVGAILSRVTSDELADTSALKQNVSACFSLDMNAQLNCINKEVEKISKEFGVRTALDVIEPLAQEKTYLLDWSHEFSHTIGGAAVASYRQKGGSLESLIGNALVGCDGWGAFGCYHGTIEAGLSLLPVKERATVIRRACMENELIQGEQYFVNQCLHWFGHGAAIFSDLSLEEALGMCDGLAPFNSDEVQLCLSGVFHAGTVPGDSDDSRLHNVENVWRAGDPYFPCLDIEEKYRGHCYSHAPGRTHSSEIKVLFDTCASIPETNPDKKLDYVWRCYESASNVLLPQIMRDVSLNDNQRALKIVNECRNSSHADYRKFCYAGAARYWVLRDPLLNNMNPFKICDAIEESAKPMCYSNIGFGNNENYYSEEKIKEYCGNGDPKYLKECIAHNPGNHIK